MVGSSLSTRTLLFALAVLATCFAAFRGDVGTVLVSCVALSAWKRTADGIAKGVATGFRQKASLLLTSTVVAAVIVGLSDATFFLCYNAYMLTQLFLHGVNHFKPYLDSEHICAGTVVAVAPSLCVTALLRKAIWPVKRSMSRLVTGATPAPAFPRPPLSAKMDRD